MENGKYKAVVISDALDESKNGTASVKIVCQTKYEVENPAFPVNATMYHDLWLSPACFERSMHTLTKVLGWKGEIFEELNDKSIKDLGINTFNNKYNEFITKYKQALFKHI